MKRNFEIFSVLGDLIAAASARRPLVAVEERDTEVPARTTTTDVISRIARNTNAYQLIIHDCCGGIVHS